MLCYAREAGRVLLLLGKERETPGWHQGSNKWSGFSGKLEQGETPLGGAAREFLEESCAAVAPDGSETPPTGPELERALGALEVVERSAETAREKVVHHTYLMQLPYGPYPARFAQMRRALLDIDAVMGGFHLLKKKSPRVPKLFLPGFQAGDLVVTDFGLSDGDVVTELRSPTERVHLSFAVTPTVAADVAELRAAWTAVLALLDANLPLLAHPAVHVRRRHGSVIAAYVDKVYLEKCELAWWPLDEVLQLIEAGQTADFRAGFLDVLAHAAPRISGGPSPI